jgi:hypothetical protein
MSDVAYIYSHDGDEHGIKFGIELCTKATLRETIRKHLYPDGIGDDPEIFNGVMEEIEDKGACDFEDGWIRVENGTAAIIEFLLAQLRECKAEERFECERAADAFKQRDAAQAKYKALQGALLTALGPSAPDIATKAAA